jgi:uncharacterized membrane protein
MKTFGSGALVSSGLLLGMGLGGFFDGILFHQLLQWHNMVSGWIPVNDLVSAKINMFWDGVFHAAVWCMTVLGLALSWKIPRVAGSGHAFAGWMVTGWGFFNVVEGAIDHLVLGIHHVHEYSPSQPAWDWAFEASGVLLMFIGLMMIVSARPARQDAATARFDEMARRSTGLKDPEYE